MNMKFDPYSKGFLRRLAIAAKKGFHTKLQGKEVIDSFGFFPRFEGGDIVEVSDDEFVDLVSQRVGGTVFLYDEDGEGKVVRIVREFKDYGKTWAISRKELEE